MVEKASTESDSMPAGPPTAQHSTFVLMLIGGLIGSIISVIGVAMVNRQAALNKRKKMKSGSSNDGPSTGSPLTAFATLDDEKFA